MPSRARANALARARLGTRLIPHWVIQVSAGAERRSPGSKNKMAVVCYFVIVGHNDHPVFETDLSKSSESQAAKVILQFVTQKCHKFLYSIFLYSCSAV